jgi:hypothetical protein
MLTVHLVLSGDEREYASWLKTKVPETVLVSKADNMTDAKKEARDFAVMSRKQPVVAVVPRVKTNPLNPMFTTEWKALADTVLVVAKARMSG